MRPSLLDPLFAPATSLDGVGAKTIELLDKVVPADVTARDTRVGDLLFVLPHSVIDRRSRPGIAGSAAGAIVTLELRVDRHQPPPRGKKNVPYRVYAHDETGEIGLTFFHAHAAYLEKQLPVGEHVIVSGADGVVQRAADDGASRPHRADGGCGFPSADGAGLSADRRPVAAHPEARHRAGGGAYSRTAGMAGRGGARARKVSASGKEPSPV